jgi:hypothetical protein
LEKGIATAGSSIADKLGSNNGFGLSIAIQGSLLWVHWQLVTSWI